MSCIVKSYRSFSRYQIHKRKAHCCFGTHFIRRGRAVIQETRVRHKSCNLELDFFVISEYTSDNRKRVSTTPMIYSLWANVARVKGAGFRLSLKLTSLSNILVCYGVSEQCTAWAARFQKINGINWLILILTTLNKAWCLYTCCEKLLYTWQIAILCVYVI